MDKKQVADKVIALIHDVTDIPEEEMSEDSAMMDELELSSLEIMSVIGSLEKAYKIRIPSKALRKIVTIGDVAEYVVQTVS